MNRGIYSAATGMAANQMMMDTVSHNLANVSTNGFKRDQLVFADQLVRSLNNRGGKGAYIGTLGNGALLTRTQTSFDVGNMVTTDNPLNVAINSEKGMFAVQTPSGTRYTRNGAFTLNGERELVTQQGFKALSTDGQPIVIPDAQDPQIDGTGVVSAGGAVVGTIAVFDGSFQKQGDTLFNGVGTSLISGPTLASGAVEQSNVNAVDSMVTMIKVQRLFEMAQKAIQTEDEQNGKLLETLR